MEGEYEERVEIARTADGFMALSRIDAIKVQVEESQAELEKAFQDPSLNEGEIEVLEDCLRNNLKLLDLIEEAEQEFYSAVSDLSD